jgi:Ca2+-binding RTX toxin-like protein
MGTYTGNDSNNTFTASQEWNSGDWWNPFDGYYEWRSWTIVGKGGNDNLTGGAKYDYIYGDYKGSSPSGISGNDILKGRGGGDAIYGEAGNDTLYGDYAFGAVTDGGVAGNDYLNGGYGDDVIHGEAGSDTLDGGYGNDFLSGGSGNDYVVGGAGNDYLIAYGFTFSERDQMLGGSGIDQFALTNGASVFYKGDGVNGYATVQDFAFGDKLRVKGPLTDYFLQKNINWGAGSNANDTGIFHGGDLIAVVQDNTSIQLNSAYFTSV